ncbi:keratin, type I cytoskeletal 9 [Tribolium castaneum]|uniref:Uncharacterized protein n=1 Tax=Tribolium castaneum TaxID=7070 RepID=D6WB43_TRICA|nr:hypothetical protein TcasGA2_TC004827 [Tribolium castaneum]
MGKLIVLLSFTLAVLAQEELAKPVYKYRYATEDVMNTAASTIPIHGYHVVEGGYYPGAMGMGGMGLGYGGYGGGIGMGGAGMMGAGKFIGGMGGAGMMGGAGLGGAGLVAAPLLHHGYGGEFIDKNVYSGEKKNLNDEAFEKASGKKGEEFNAGKEGFTKGVAAVKNNKGESAYFNDAKGAKKMAEDGKAYYGGQHFDKEGKHGGQFNEKKGHKKGHVIKGFKSSHHKDETGKTEEFYDEENDEGAKLNFNGEAGSFGEKGASQFKGGHEAGEFAEGAAKKAGHFDNEHFVDNSNAGHGNYGEKKYGGSGSVYGVNNGIDQHSLLGHQENSKIYKHFPHHVPFY